MTENISYRCSIKRKTLSLLLTSLSNRFVEFHAKTFLHTTWNNQEDDYWTHYFEQSKSDRTTYGIQFLNLILDYLSDEKSFDVSIVSKEKLPSTIASIILRLSSLSPSSECIVRHLFSILTRLCANSSAAIQDLIKSDVLKGMCLLARNARVDSNDVINVSTDK